MYNRHASSSGACHAVLWIDCEHGVALVDRQLTLHHAWLYTRSFRTSACGQAACEERLIPAPVDGLPTESDSLAQRRIGLCRTFSKGMEDSRCGHRVRECVQSAVCGQTENWGSRSWTSSVHSQRSTVAHKLFFKTSACGQAATEERLCQRLWTGSLRRATPSRRAARGHLTHVHGATCRRTTRARAKGSGPRARDSQGAEL